jgi:S1-C subfamily serine protease
MVVGFSTDASPALRAGLEPEDVIVALDGEEVDYVAQLQQIVGFKRPGETVEVTVRRRGGEERSFTVRLDEARETEPQQVAQAEPEEQPEGGSYEDKLGIRVEELSDDMIRADRRLTSEQQGLVITAVDQSGPARNAVAAANARQGLLPIITHVNGERVRTLDDLERLLPAIQPGDVVSLRLFLLTRDGAGPQVVRYRAGR